MLCCKDILYKDKPLWHMTAKDIVTAVLGEENRVRRGKIGREVRTVMLNVEAMGL